MRKNKRRKHGGEREVKSAERGVSGSKQFPLLAK